VDTELQKNNYKVQVFGKAANHRCETCKSCSRAAWKCLLTGEWVDKDGVCDKHEIGRINE
jgi:hypothetical protein